MLAAAGADGMIRLFDVNHSSAIMGWPAYDDHATCVVFCPDENSLLSCDSRGAVTEWNLKRPGHKVQTYDLPGKLDVKKLLNRYEISYTNSGKHFVVCSSHNNALLYESGVPQHVQDFTGHQRSVTCLDWYPLDSPLCVTASLDHQVLLRRYKLAVLKV